MILAFSGSITKLHVVKSSDSRNGLIYVGGVEFDGQKLGSTAPMHDDFEIRTLSLSLTRLREELGPDHQYVKKVLGKLAPEELSRLLVKGSKLESPTERKTANSVFRSAAEIAELTAKPITAKIAAAAKPI